MKWLGILLMSLAVHVSAATLEWDSNSETNLAGYKVYTGLASRNYTTVFTTTNTTFTITNVVVSKGTNYFTVTAFDTDGLESDFSDEVSGVFTNRLPKVRSVRFRAQLSVQSAPSAIGPWSASDIAQIEATPGSQFYRLKLAPMMEVASIAKILRPEFTSGSKSGKLTTTPKRKLRIVLPPQLP